MNTQKLEQEIADDIYFYLHQNLDNPLFYDEGFIEKIISYVNKNYLSKLEPTHTIKIIPSVDNNQLTIEIKEIET